MQLQKDIEIKYDSHCAVVEGSSQKERKKTLSDWLTGNIRKSLICTLVQESAGYCL